jgi:hypothetical protein
VPTDEPTIQQIRKDIDRLMNLRRTRVFQAQDDEVIARVVKNLEQACLDADKGVGTTATIKK